MGPLGSAYEPSPGKGFPQISSPCQAQLTAAPTREHAALECVVWAVPLHHIWCARSPDATHTRGEVTESGPTYPRIPLRPWLFLSSPLHIRRTVAHTRTLQQDGVRSRRRRLREQRPGERVQSSLAKGLGLPRLLAKGFGLVFAVVLLDSAGLSPDGARAASPLLVSAAKTPRALPLASHPLVSLARTQPVAAASGGLLLALLIADRLVLWKRPRWLLRLPDEGVLLPIGEGNGFPLGSRLFRLLKYRQ
jgi:hypothetical protein